MPRPILFALIVTLSSCGGCRTDTSNIEVGNAPIGLELKRLDQHLFRSDPDSLREASLEAQAEFGDFYALYIEDILQGAPLNDPRSIPVLRRFITDPDWLAVQQAIDSVFPSMEPHQREFELAFRRLKALFPDSIAPDVICFNSGFNYGIYPTDSVLGIGLEWFIGAEHPVIAMLAPEAFPAYVKDRMRPEMLVPSSVKGWLLVHYLRDAQGEDLLTNLVETGKVMVLLDALLPDVPVNLKFAFTPQQLAWVEANEFSIWREIVANDMLFSKKPDQIGRFFNDGPFTNGFPRESPGHMGEWIGYRMVRSYMKEHTEVTFPDLFRMKDAREILKEYKPK